MFSVFQEREEKEGKSYCIASIQKEKNEQWLIKKPVITNYDGMTYDAKYENHRIHPEDEETVIKYQKYNIDKNKNR